MLLSLWDASQLVLWNDLVFKGSLRSFSFLAWEIPFLIFPSSKCMCVQASFIKDSITVIYGPYASKSRKEDCKLVSLDVNESINPKKSCLQMFCGKKYVQYMLELKASVWNVIVRKYIYEKKRWTVRTSVTFLTQDVLACGCVVFCLTLHVNNNLLSRPS